MSDKYFVVKLGGEDGADAGATAEGELLCPPMEPPAVLQPSVTPHTLPARRETAFQVNYDAQLKVLGHSRRGVGGRGDLRSALVSTIIV